MTVATPQWNVTYTGNSATTVFPFPFPVPNINNLVVTIDNAGVTSILPQNSYRVSGIGSPSGGTVTYAPGGTPIPSTQTITLTRNVPYGQSTDLVNQDGYYPKVVEAAMDALAMQIMQGSIVGASPYFALYSNVTGIMYSNGIDISALVIGYGLILDGDILSLGVATSGGGVVPLSAALTAISPTTGALAADAVTFGTIAAGAVTTAAIAASAVTAAQIALGAVGTNQIALGAITGALIASGAVYYQHFAPNLGPITIVTSLPTLPSTDFPNNSVVSLTTDGKLYRNVGGTWSKAVDGVDLIPGSVTGSTALVAGSITAAQIAANTITASQIAANTITASQIAANTITASQIAAGSITSTQIAANSIVAGNIATGTITSALIYAGTIVSGNIAASTILGTNIAAGTLTATNIAAGTITATQIATGTITATSAIIANAAIGTLEIAGNAVTIPTAAYTAGPVSPTGGSYQTIQSVSWTSSGALTFVTVTFSAGNWSVAGALYIQCIDDLSNSLITTAYISIAYENYAVSFSYTPTAGARTLYLKVNAFATGPFINISLLTMEVKR